ncbi:MAG: MBL fold metallo-hydrolase [Desulfomonilaceae bacterium]|nr:MBL fold metallo-hydrolase [Desulfomonilaceae bacterium]
MKITFWGTRGSIASPGQETVIYGGNTTCLEITLPSGRTVVIDAGTGIRKLGDALLKRDAPLDLHLLMTHVHWDHLMGMPFFGPLFHPDCRITLDGWSKGFDGLKAVFIGKHVDGTWPIGFDAINARVEPRQRLTGGELRLDGITITSHPLQHPQGGLGFRFSQDSGTFVFLTDNELMDDGWRGCCFPDFVRFCRGADVLVHDCQYLPEEMDTRRGWGHSDVSSVARLAVEAEVGKLVLFHHDPWRTDQAVTDMEARCKMMVEELGAHMEVQAAREGTTLTV